MADWPPAAYLRVRRSDSRASRENPDNRSLAQALRALRNLKNAPTLGTERARRLAAGAGVGRMDHLRRSSVCAVPFRWEAGQEALPATINIVLPQRCLALLAGVPHPADTAALSYRSPSIHRRRRRCGCGCIGCALIAAPDDDW
jgi:hypothetical protein